MDFRIDVDFNEEDFNKAIMKAAESGVRDVANEMNRDFAEMAGRLKGRPLDEIKAELVRYYRDRDGEISDPELTDYAEILQEGETSPSNMAG
jgi:hypothetical protein